MITETLSRQKALIFHVTSTQSWDFHEIMHLPFVCLLPLFHLCINIPVGKFPNESRPPISFTGEGNFYHTFLTYGRLFLGCQESHLLTVVLKVTKTMTRCHSEKTAAVSQLLPVVINQFALLISMK